MLIYASAVLLMVPLFSSCSDEPVATPIVDQTDNNDSSDQTASNHDLIMRHWVVEEAYVNGSTPDVSSKGLEIEFKSNKAYTLFMKDGSTFDGTWEFIDNETKVDIDKNGQFHQTWTIQELSKTKLDVKFVSPFTHQNAQWIMK